MLEKTRSVPEDKIQVHIVLEEHSMLSLDVYDMAPTAPEKQDRN